MLSVYALDDLARIDPIEGYSKLRVTERDLAAGEWFLEMPLVGATSVAAALRLATWPGIEVVDEETGRGFGGFLTRRALGETDGKLVARFWGLDFQGWMNGWLQWPDSSDVGRWWIRSLSTALPLTRAVHNAAHFNFGSGALVSRQMPNVAGITAAIVGEGPPPTWMTEGEPMLDLFRRLCYGTDYTTRLTLNRPTGSTAELLFDCSARPTVERVYHVGSVDSTSEEAAARLTRAMGMGEEDGVEAGSRFVSDQQTTPTDWQTRYWEAFRERPALAQAELDDETSAWLTELGPTSTLDIGDVEVAGGWGREIDIGWKATIRLDERTAVDTFVAASTLTVEGGQTKRTVSFGEESLTVEERMLQQVAALAQRINRLEREGVKT